MAMLSKFVELGFKDWECSNALIHSNGCFENAAYNLYRFAVSNSKYFAPIIFMPLLLKIRKLNRKKVEDTSLYYLEAIICGVATGWSISVMICMLRHIYGKFGLYTVTFIPTMFGAVATMCTSTARVRRLFFATTIQCALESQIIKRRNFVTKLLADSLAIKTLVFMCCSSIIMQAKRQNKFRGFWFLQPNALKMVNQTPNPEKLQQEEQETKRELNITSNAHCTHTEQSCNQHLMRGVRNYMLIGLSLDFIKMLLSKKPADAKGFLGTLTAKLCTFRLRSTAFLTSYMSIYRFTHCYLNRNTKSNQELNHILATFFGGASYMLYPKLTLQCYAIIVCVEILWTKFKFHKTEKRYEALELLKRFPSAHMLYLFSLAYLVHTYCWRKDYVSNLGEIVINGITDNYAKRINMRVIAVIKSFEKHIYGKFGLYTVTFIPTMFGAVATMCTSTARVRRLFYATTIQCALESQIIKRRNFVTKLLADSLAIKTLVFMCCSSIIMQAKRQNKFRGFWFLQPNALKMINQTPNPEKLQQEEEETKRELNITSNAHCTHTEPSCNQHLMRGVRNYMLIGLSLDFIKMLLSKKPADAKGFLGTLTAKLCTFRLRSTAFLTSYMSIYRFTHCYLNRNTKSNQELNHILATFFGGASYMLYPKLTLQCYAIIVSVEILWTKFKSHKTEKRYEALELLKRFPSAHMLYLFSLAYLVHTYSWRKDCVSNLGQIVINGLTDNYAKRMNMRVDAIIKSFEK